MSSGYLAMPTPHAYSICPSWLITEIADEVLAMAPNGLYTSPELAPKLAREREDLLKVLAEAKRAAPEDGWILGQQIRFLLEAGQAAPARDALKDCTTAPWLCGMLRGHIAYTTGDQTEAEAHFANALGGMSMRERCSFTDISTLLASDVRDNYLALPCSVRDSLAQQYLWMADPALSTPLNERRVTHLSRQVSVILQSATSRDERFHWEPSTGGVPATDLIVRYGWPSISAWQGFKLDREHASYLAERDSPDLAPYATAEYTWPRVTLGAPDLLAMDVLDIPADSWTLGPPASMENRRLGTALWWPREHMALPNLRLAQFTDWQIATFRRQDNVRMAAALHLGATHTATGQITAGRDTLSFLISPGPDSVVRIGSTTNTTDTIAVVEGHIAPTAGLVALELFSGAKDDRRLTRMRQGYRMPQTLASLHRDSIGVSEPVLFFANDAELPTGVESLLPRMLPTLNMDRRTPVGIYWEAYGLPTTDSVRFAIAIEPKQRGGFLRRAASTLRLMDAPPDGVTISWLDPSQRGGEPATPSSTIRIVSRAMKIDLSRISAGEHIVSIVAKTSSGRTAEASRVIRVR
ncbi:MAG TPA: hypothetical protein VGE27_03065 [Gemmatimonas sp.]|uniref:hypothetical protein n=1 Tax=Gemmatimonas sp. TaxID=1962908 RepID=UPI002ED8176C